MRDALLHWRVGRSSVRIQPNPIGLST